MNALEIATRNQDELNEIITKNWKTKGLRFDRALRQEAAEAMDSLPWKWWKKGDYDIENLRVEGIDMLHFSFSMLVEMQYRQYSYLENRAVEVIEEFSNSSTLPKDAYANLLESQIDKIVKSTFVEPRDPVEVTIEIFKFIGMLGMSYEDSIKLFLSKRALNEFRTLNKYKEGGYIKVWDGKEDNVYMQDIIKTMKVSDNFVDQVFDKLSSKYEEVKKNAK